MMALARLWFASWLLLLTSIATNAWADTTLVGSMTLGDGNNAIASDVVMSRSGSVYQPNYPIHFKLTAASTITEVRLKNVTGLSQAAVLVRVVDLTRSLPPSAKYRIAKSSKITS